MRRITWLSPEDPPGRFPPSRFALEEPNGLLAAGGDLSPERIIAAYRRGVFPWYSPGQPVLWWTPDPRMVLFPDEFRCSRSLAKTIRQGRLAVVFDQDFESVLKGCAGPRSKSRGTWITPEMAAAYTALHRRGVAHSIETRRDGVLVGGLYGLLIGRVFFGESMFSAERDASKVAMAALVAESVRRDIALIDCQLPSPHLESLGCRPIPRSAFETLLARLLGTPDSR